MRSFAIVTALVLLSGCGGPKVDPDPGPEKPRSWVEVRNHFALPVEIFAVGNGTVHRLGTVHPGMNAHYVLPPVIGNGNSVTFRASAGAGVAPVYESGEMLIQPGTIVDFDVASVLFNSTAVIRP